MKSTDAEILWTLALLKREARSIRENTVEARRYSDPFTRVALIQAESYESMAKKLDDLLGEKNKQEHKTSRPKDERTHMNEFLCTREDLAVLLRGAGWEVTRCGYEAQMHNRDSKFSGEIMRRQRNAEWIAQNLELLLGDPNVRSFKIAAQLRRREQA